MRIIYLFLALIFFSCDSETYFDEDGILITPYHKVINGSNGFSEIFVTIKDNENKPFHKVISNDGVFFSIINKASIKTKECLSKPNTWEPIRIHIRYDNSSDGYIVEMYGDCFNNKDNEMNILVIYSILKNGDIEYRASDYKLINKI